MMAYFYLDDGNPESEDYESNYLYFNADDPGCIQKMTMLAQILESVPVCQKRSVAEKFLQREMSG
ncbi:MAG: hypothetical protein EHM72_18295 [Calditrichaeota bacterium]|nr:MAG: hypothetical protein EHM72_18295 [Calditrichota bacterium]